MASDNDSKSIAEAAPSATNEAVLEQQHPEAPEAGPSINLNPPEGDNIRPQETGKVPERDVTTTPTFPWKWPREWAQMLQEEFSKAYTSEEKHDALDRTVKVVKQYSDEMVKRWNQEIDNLLVYAGLFSAVLTAFNVQSYILLQPSTPDPTLLMLQQISQQLNSFSVTPPGTLVNSTHPVNFMPVQASPVEPWAVWLNSLWFSSLICSLSSASVGIMVKQWMHEYQAGTSGDSLEIARLRQYRLNNLEKWHVAEIVAFLPVLLQIALFLFFSGLLILLWHYHSTVAIVASVLVGIVALFVVGTTIMPLIWRNCCYLSPPVYLMFNIVQHVKYGLGWFRVTVCGILYQNCRRNETFWHMPLQGLRSWARKHRHNLVTLTAWRGREQSTVQSASCKLDIDMTVHAYSTTIDTRHLSDAGAILASHGVDAIQTHYTEVQKINEQHFGQKDIEVLSVEVWASQLFYSIREWSNVVALSAQHALYRDSLSSSMYHRLLLALAAAVSKSDVTSDVYWQSLFLLEKLFTSNSDALKLMPWNAVQHVAAAMETSLPRMLSPSDDEHGQEVYWVCVFCALRILVRCCFAPVSSWERSPKDMRACMQYVLRLEFLQKESLRENASKEVWPLRTFNLLLTYLGESADAWGCCPAVEDFMEAVRTVIEIGEGTDDDDLKEYLPKLKDRFRECESLLAKQVTSAQPAEIEGAPEITAAGTDQTSAMTDAPNANPENAPSAGS